MSRSSIVSSRAVSSNAQTLDDAWQRAASRRGRSAPARRSSRDRLAHRLGPRRPRRRRSRRAGPKRPSSPSIALAEQSAGASARFTRPRLPGSDLDARRRLGPAARQRRAGGRGDDRLAVRRQRRERARAGDRSSSSLRTSSRRRSGGVPRRSAVRSASARTSARTAVRCSPCEPKLRRSRSADAIRDVAQVRAERGRPALEVAVEPLLERLDGGRVGLVARAARLRVRARRRARRTRARTPRRAPPAARSSSAPSSATRSVHGASASRPETPPRTRRSDSFRWASARAVLGGERRHAPAPAGRASGRRTSGARSGRPSRRPAGRGRRRARPAACGAPRRSRARRRSAAAASPRPGTSVTSVSTGDPPSSPASMTRAPSCAEAHELPLRARTAERSPALPTWSASSRFVFPTPFRPVTSTSPGGSSSSSARVRAEVAKRHARNDHAPPGRPRLSPPAGSA